MLTEVDHATNTAKLADARVNALLALFFVCDIDDHAVSVGAQLSAEFVQLVPAPSYRA